MDVKFQVGFAAHAAFAPPLVRQVDYLPDVVVVVSLNTTIKDTMQARLKLPIWDTRFARSGTHVLAVMQEVRFVGGIEPTRSAICLSLSKAKSFA